MPSGKKKTRNLVSNVYILSKVINFMSKLISRKGITRRGEFQMAGNRGLIGKKMSYL